MIAEGQRSESAGDLSAACGKYREAVRAAAVDPDPEAAEQAAKASGPLSPSRLEVETRNRGGPGSRVTVAVSYLAVNPIPLLRNVVHDRRLTAQATMRVER